MSKFGLAGYGEVQEKMKKRASELIIELSGEGLTIVEVEIVADFLKDETARLINEMKFTTPFRMADR